MILLSLSLTSCGTVKYVGNPDPNMKTVHFQTTHAFENYTQKDYEEHPDHDCNGQIRYARA